MRRIGELIVLLCMIFPMACNDPFFPRTGKPLEAVTGLRATPQGVIDQLIESYDNRNIELFRDLFPADGSFRFFMAPDFFNDNRSRYLQSSEPRDPRLQFLEESDFYHFWTQEREIENHAKLFSQAEFIEFTDKPALGSIHRFVDNGDSMVEIEVTGGRLEIGRLIDNIIEVYVTEVDRQVFLIRKEPSSLWVILKWYDFSISKRS